MSAPSYAAVKGSSGAGMPPRPRAGARPIDSEEERERIARNYALVKAHAPELVPFIKELHAAGLIDGLRAIQNVQLHNGKEP